MPAVNYAGHEIEVNEEGFLVNSEQWTKEIAESIATEAGVGPLTEKHWEVIDFCRKDAQEQGTPPGLLLISKFSSVNMKELYQLFPKGSGKLAAKVSGLPKPQGCI